MWKICGITNYDSVRAVYFLSQRYQPAIMVIVKPKMSGVQANAQVACLGFLGHQRVKVDGFNGGIWLLWHPHLISVNIISEHFQCLHV